MLKAATDTWPVAELSSCVPCSQDSLLLVPSSGFLLTAIADALGTIWSTYAKRNSRRIENIDDTAKHGTICEFTMIEQTAVKAVNIFSGVHQSLPQYRSNWGLGFEGRTLC